MLREMAEAVELFTTRRGLVLVLEDLHWSDVSTLDWLTHVARRREPAKLLLLGTYRPVDVLAGNHPLRGAVQELQARQQCEEIRLTPLKERAITAYLTERFGELTAPDTLTATLARRTGGNPLFVVNTVDYLVEQEVVTEEAGRWTIRTDKVKEVSEGIPDTLRQLIERQVERLSDEDKRVLEVASVAGVEFTVAEAAAGLQGNVEALESQYEGLAQTGQFLRAEGVAEWPDGTLSGRYSFLHAVYHEVVSDRVGEARRIQWHRRIAERKEAAYGERKREIAAELAVHFERGREHAKAVQCHRQAGEAAARSGAPREALSHLKRGLELLTRLPDTPERTQQELRLQLTLGEQLTSLTGFGVEDVEQAFARARELCRQLGETPQLFRVVLGLWAFYVERAELATARELAEQLLRFAQHVQSPPLFVWARLSLGITLHFAGEQVSARRHLEECVSLYDPQHFRSSGAPYDPAVLGHTTLGPVLWLLGYPEQALEQSQKGLALARALSQPYSVIYAANLVTRTHLLRAEPQAAREHIEGLIALCREQGFASYLALSLVVQGWLQAEQGRQEAGIAQMHQELAAWRATGAESARPYYLALLAEAYGKVGDPDKGLAVLAEWPRFRGRVVSTERRADT
jgi:tetratricopeptide (TPR) repeat protein